MPGISEQEAIVAGIKPLLAGHEPAIQGAALAELLALWLAGHHPAIRGEILALHVSAVGQLLPVAEREIFGDGSRPEGWANDRRQRGDDHGQAIDAGRLRVSHPHQIS
jgi:hypothetical protein